MAPWHFLYFFPLPHGHGALGLDFFPICGGDGGLDWFGLLVAVDWIGLLVVMD